MTTARNESGGGGGSSSASSTPVNNNNNNNDNRQQVDEDYRLLLTPMFAAMTRITDNLFLTGVGGLTRENIARNHIDFVVNITTDAPFWEDIESLRIALEDDPSTNMLPYLDFAVDKIHEAISRRNAHVLVHCVAGVSRSASVVIAYLMKYRRLTLHQAFNHCYQLRPVIRPNNGFMIQLINYEIQLFGRPSAHMIQVNVDGTLIQIPNFFLPEHPRLVLLEVFRARDLQRHEEQPSRPQPTANQQIMSTLSIQPTIISTMSIQPQSPSQQQQLRPPATTASSSQLQASARQQTPTSRPRSSSSSSISNQSRSNQRSTAPHRHGSRKMSEDKTVDR